MLSWFSRKDPGQDIVEHRKMLRLEVEIDAVVVIPGRPEEPCKVTEASPYGFRMLTVNRIPDAKQVRLLIDPETRSGRIEVPLQVLWARRAGDQWLCGGRFGKMEANQWRRLVRRLFQATGVDLADVTERRRHIRIPQHGTIGSEAVVIRDVSASGVGLLAQHPQSVGEPLEISLNLDGRPIPCRGHVVRCEQVPGQAYHHVGVAFADDMDARVKKTLERAIAKMVKA